jgi:iron(III) transport system permease protein
MSTPLHDRVRVQFAKVHLWHWIVLALLILVVATPLSFLVLGSLSNVSIPTEFDLTRLSFDNYARVWSDPGTYRVMTNTLIYVSGATVVGISVATILAWLTERTNIRGKVLIYVGIPMTLAMPGMLQAMAYVLLLSPRIGFLNKLMAPLGLGPINIYSLGGMMFIEGIRLVPTAFLMLVPLLRSMDPSLEEAAAMSGAPPHSSLRKVTMRLMLPGLLAVMIYQFMTALEAFEVPGILGLPASTYVFSTKIYSILQIADGVPAYGDANALAMVYVLIAISATWLYARVIARSEQFSIITGKGYRPREADLGRWSWCALLLVSLFLVFAIVLPFLVLLYVSFLGFLQVPSAAAFRSMTFGYYRELIENPLIAQVLWNTLLMVAITSTLTVAISFSVSLIVVRSKFWGRRLLDQLVFLPHAIPGIVMGLAFLWVFLRANKLGIPIHGGVLAISLAFTVSFIAYGTRAMNAAILQIHKDLEEAAQVSGAPYWRTMWRIFVPLMLPTFVGVWIWTMLHAIRIAGTPLLLYEGNENQVLSVLIWSMWDSGEIQGVGAIGVLMILVLFVMIMLLRIVGFGRGSHVQGAK